MRNTPSTPWAVASLVVLAAAMLVVSPAYAAKDPGATLGPVLTGGTLYSGGDNFYYQANITAFTPGAVSIEATVKGKGWKATFPVLAAALETGTGLVTSEGIAVPAGFEGSATLKIKATYNGGKLGKKSLTVIITEAPDPVAEGPQTILHDVGFNVTTNLNANIAPTNGLGPITSYAWTQTGGPAVELDDPTSPTPAFTTLAITNFVPLEDHFGIQGVNSDEVGLSTYEFQVVISDGVNASTGTVSVISGNVSPGQTSVPIGLNTYLRAAAEDEEEPRTTNSWTLVAKPTGSTATLKDASSRTPFFRPDREGEYLIRDNITQETITIKGASFISSASCAQCHGPTPIANVGLKDYVTPWSETGHATFFRRALDGQVSDHYGENCVSCHVTGYNKAPLADNGGFDDVAADVGWLFPNPLQAGNFNAMPANLQDLGTIGCESCHGPGSQHPGAASVSLDAQVCASCHQDGHYHTRVEQWEASPHADPFKHVSEEEGTNPSCAKCHSPAGFVDQMKGVAPVRAEIGKLTCQTCHDPHNLNNFPDDAHMVRIYDTVTLDDSVKPAAPPVVTGAGTSALCMFCHNARRSPPATYASGSTLPHESTAADVLLGIRASTQVQVVSGGVTNTIASVTLENSAHTTVATCVDCHMAANPPAGDPNHNLVGDHTFSVRNVETGEENIASCNVCHAGVDTVSSFDHVGQNGEDFDGDGEVEGIQSEVEGLRANLEARMLATGLTKSSSYPFWGGYSTNTTLRAVQRNATWNAWLIERDLSHGVHNAPYTVRLLQWSYTVLSTNAVPAGNPYWVDYPNAFIK